MDIGLLCGESGGFDYTVEVEFEVYTFCRVGNGESNLAGSKLWAEIVTETNIMATYAYASSTSRNAAFDGKERT